MIYGLAPQISKIASLFALPVITKDLTELDYGIWGTILAYTGAIQAFASLGLNVVMSNSFFKMPFQYKWMWRQLYGFLQLWSPLYSLIVCLVVYFAIPEGESENLLLLMLLIAGPNLLFGPASSIGTYYFQFNQRPFPIAARVGLFGMLTVALNVYTISFLKMGYLGWAYSFFIVSMLQNLSYFYLLNFRLHYSPIFNFKWRTIQSALKIGWPTIPHTYAAYLLNSSDRVVMDQLNVSTQHIGRYNLASTFGSYFANMAGAVNQAITPILLSCYKQNEFVKARNLIFVIQGYFILVTFTYSIWAREIFYLLINNTGLREVYPLSIIIVMSYNYRPMYNGAVGPLFYIEKTHLIWRITFTAGIVNVLVNVLFIPIYGYQVAAYSTFVCLLIMGFSGFYMPGVQGTQKANFYPFFWLGLILLMTAVASFMVYLGIFVKIMVTIGIVVSGAFLTRAARVTLT